MKRLKRRHRLDARMYGWIVETAKRHHWRMPTWYDIDDLIQEGLIVYSVCVQKYAYVTDVKLFMALMQRSYINHIHNLANQRTRLSEFPMEPDSEVLVGTPEDGDAILAITLEELPARLKPLLSILQSNNKPPLRYFKSGPRETTNQWLCRLLGVDHHYVNVKAVLAECLA